MDTSKLISLLTSAELKGHDKYELNFMFSKYCENPEFLKEYYNLKE